MPFATAIDTVPKPFVVLGTPLRPFCLGHHLLFKRLDLPFCDNPDSDASADQFVRAIAICAGDSYEWTLSAMLGGDWPGIVGRWSKRSRKRGNWQHAVDTFRDYLEDGNSFPPVCHRGDSEVELTSPWECRLKCGLVGAGFSESEALNGYLPGRWYDYLTVAEFRQLQNCRDPKNWRKLFWTEADVKRLEAVA